ncbi:hypothetical protein [Flavobacterium sp.]|uniref:hypothetical protein n=1 Tax=Flavobacterium sp. TaxID=239 RepID=UPI0038FC9948
MDKIEFSGKYLSFKARLIKGLLPLIIILVWIILLFVERILRNNGIKLRGILILLLVFIVSTVIAIAQSKNYVTSVNIENGNIRFIGYNYDNKYSKELDLNEVKVSIRFQGKRNVDYFLEFKAGRKKFLINELKNWNYNDVADLFRSFKTAKNEKVIFDDEYWLDVMEKKAKGMTSYQAVMSKGNKNAT